MFIHDNKQHGLDCNLFDEILESDVDLFIIADSSTNDIEQHELLLEKGKDIILLDHHRIDREVSNEVYLVNNQLEGSESSNLSGVGVVYKFIQACGYNVDKYMDIVAVGIVADSMDLLDLENRAIVNNGLSNLQNETIKQFFKDIKDPTITDISFNLANYMNSVIRYGKREEKELLWKALIGEDGEVEYKKRDGTIVKQTLPEALIRISNNAKSRQNRMVKKVVEEVKKEIYKLGLDKNKCIILNYQMEGSLRGLIAQKLCSYFSKPIILLAPYKDVLSGSMRSPFEGFKEMLEESNLVPFVQGHSAAAGLNLKERDIDALTSYLNSHIEDSDINEAIVNVDYIFDINDVNLNTVKEIANLNKLFCRSVQEPLFILKNITIESRNIELKRVQKGYCVQFKHKGMYFKKEFASRDTYENMTCAEQLKFGRSQLLGLTLLVKFKKDNRGFYYISIEDFNSVKSSKISF